ncbi:hypothetical protein [Leptospira interrogans]|uniref:hypothetical protein n=1 Tax=Leptospira interrogans TaxID=173 RepID=UPI00030B4D1A|nr:hypothetical protein [Leptospira interrogans]
MNKPNALKKKDILKLIEQVIGPDELSYTEEYIFHKKSDFAKALMISGLNQIRDINVNTITSNLELIRHLIHLAGVAVIWISALDPIEVKGYADHRLGPLSPWTKEPAKTNSETTV